MHQGKQFEQLSIPGVDVAQPSPKLPHQMNPTEFINHPDTMLHSSERAAGPLTQGIDPDAIGKHRVTHAGTPFAALQRSNQALDFRRPTQMHRVHVPRSEVSPGVITDTEANPDVSRPDPTPRHYKNGVEDEGSISLVTGRDRPLTHSHYVEEAIAKGLEHEIHPTTLALHKSGNLSHPYDSIISSARRTLQTTSEAIRFAQHHHGGLFPVTAKKVDGEGLRPHTGNRLDLDPGEEHNTAIMGHPRALVTPAEAEANLANRQAKTPVRLETDEQ